MFNNPFEPSADMRQTAKLNWDFYQAHMQAGFSEDQAMSLLCSIMSTAIAEQIRMAGDDNGGDK